MRINVVHLVDDLKIGGLERTLAMIVENLDRSKYNISIWCLIGEGHIAEELKEKGFPVKLIGISNSAKITSLLKLTRSLKRERVQIVHAWGVSGGVWGRIASIIAGVPIRFVHVQNLYNNLSKKARLIEVILSFFTDKVIACSEAVRRCLIECIGIRRDRIETIYNSTDIESFNKIYDVQDVRNEFNLSKEDIVIGTVSRLTPVKGHRYLLEAAVEILKEFPQLRILIAGEGPLREELEHKTEELGIKKNVIFTGPRDDIPRILSVLNILVQPSIIREGLPLAIAEAQARSLPVVASNIGGNAEAVIDKETGLLFPPEDINALSNSLIFLLRNPRKAKQMGQAGRRLCEQKFSCKEMIKKIDNLYTSCVHLKLTDKTITQHINQLNLSSAYYADELFQQGKRIRAYNIFWYLFLKPILSFLRKLIIMKGFMKGTTGFIISVFTGVTVLLTYSKLWEKQKNE